MLMKSGLFSHCCPLVFLLLWSICSLDTEDSFTQIANISIDLWVFNFFILDFYVIFLLIYFPFLVFFFRVVCLFVLFVVVPTVGFPVLCPMFLTGGLACGNSADAACRVCCAASRSLGEGVRHTLPSLTGWSGPLQKVDSRAVVLLFYRPCVGESLFESECWMFKTCHCLVDDLDFWGGNVWRPFRAERRSGT